MSFKQDASGYWIEVAPGALLDYAESWADWLNAGDTIQSAVWTVSTGLAIEAQSKTGTEAKVWLSGFALGTTYEASCKITTVNGRVDVRSFRLICKKR